MIKITGYKEIDRALKGLPAQFSHKIVGSAHFKAAKPFVEREKLLAPEGPTGNLVDSIGAVRLPLKSSRVAGAVVVGPRRRKGRYKGHAGHLVEFGTKERATKGKGKYRAGADRGKMTAKPFAEPAFAQENLRVLSSIQRELEGSMTRYLKRTVRK